MSRFSILGPRSFTSLFACWSAFGCLASAQSPKAPLIKLPVTFGAAMENTPFVFGDRPLLALKLSPANPILEAGPGEGINNSDVDLFEWEGNTYLYYATGDQATWGSVRVAMHAGPLRQFFESCYPAGTPCTAVTTRQ